MRPSWLPGSRAAEAYGDPRDDTRLLVGRAGGLVAIDPEASVVEVVELIITHALRDRASDVHIEPQPGRVRVRYRVDGVLHEVLELPSRMGQPVVSRIKVLAQMDIVERRRPQDGQFSMDVDGFNLDVRVATTATLSGEKCVLRLLDSAERGGATSGRPARLDELEMHAETAAAWAAAVASPFGMVLCSGPTGSGKTTTLYATIAELDDPGVNIMTIEDPVEYVVESVNQIQINHGIGVTFASGLKSIMRQDPDVILVGEIRDVETARIAVQSALTGHLVLSTVHATDSVSALYRFLEMGIELFLVTSSIVAVMAQRLVRRMCLTCRQESEPSVGELALYYRAGGPAKTHFYAGLGCADCGGTGYHGRVGVYELLRVTPAIRALLVAGASQDDVRALAITEGLRTLAEDAVRLVAEDVTTLTEVLRAVAAG